MVEPDHIYSPIAGIMAVARTIEQTHAIHSGYIPCFSSLRIQSRFQMERKHFV